MPEVVHELNDRGVGSAADALVGLGERRGYTVGAVGPGTFRFERATRPVWATVLAIVTMPLLGLGLLFLRVRHHESAVLSVYEDRAGTKLRVVGEVDPEVIAQLIEKPQMSATSSPSPTPKPPAPVPPTRSSPPEHASSASLITTPPGLASGPISEPNTPHKSPDDLGDVAATVARPRRAMPAADSVAARSWRVVLPDGSAHRLASAVVLGRDPKASDGELKLVFDHMSLSKTHLRLDPSMEGVRVTDLHSTNGSVTSINGVETLAEPGSPVLLPDGAVVVAGQVRIVIDGAAE